LITELRPAALDQLGLEPALLALLDRARASGLAVDGQVDLAYQHERADARLIADVEITAYRIVQEALTNASKHGGATHVTVEMVEDDSHLSIRVSDDGVGFDQDIETEGFGLAGMSERVELLTGQLAIDSSPGTGTTVIVSLPALRRPVPEAGTAAAGSQREAG
jgi:signal transduction histidine kinase